MDTDSYRYTGDKKHILTLTQGNPPFVRINLTRNNFEFNRKYFLQIKGLAMGNKFTLPLPISLWLNGKPQHFPLCIKKASSLLQVTWWYLRYLNTLKKVLWIIFKHSEQTQCFHYTKIYHQPHISRLFGHSHIQSAKFRKNKHTAHWSILQGDRQSCSAPQK